ncbi:MAG: glycosyltransferase family 2 protein [Candidatus Paceibacterota bacterium]|jgi:glycosyltransferase involved in cell wall biosynthesis
MVNPRSITAIIPVHNESKTVERVAEDLLLIRFLKEIIFIDDGSTDSTWKKLLFFQDKVTLLQNKTNCGKGYSIAQGLKLASTDIVVLLDGDILNYTECDLKKLIEPVLNDTCDFTIKPTDDVWLKFLGGVRCYKRKDLIPLIDKMEKSSKYGIEVLLNKEFRNKKGIYVKLYDYHHLIKTEKFPLPKAVFEYIKEGLSVIKQLI